MGGVVDEDWTNHYLEVLQHELGEEVYQSKLDQQEKDWQHADDPPKKFDGISVALGLSKARSWAASHARKFPSFDSRPLNAPYSNTGVGAVGYAVVLDNPLIPTNDFFFPGRLFEVRARHSSSPYTSDDSKIGIRKLDIKFSDHEKESSWDLLCETGELSMFYNQATLVDYMKLFDNVENWMNLHDYLTSAPIYLEAFIDAVRLPVSYTKYFYHSQFPVEFKASDNVQRLIKFRIIPKDGKSDVGRPNCVLQKQAWLMDRAIDDDLGRHMLKEDFLSNLENNTVEYLVQCQIYEQLPGAAFETTMYNPSEIWSRKLYPWMDLIRVSLNQPVQSEVLDISKYSMEHLPPVLSIPAALTVRDFNYAVNARRVMTTARMLNVPQEPALSGDLETTDYLIHLALGGRSDAGVKSSISVSIVGVCGRTSYRHLAVLPRGALEEDSKHTYHVTDRVVGTFLCIKLHKQNDAGNASDWFLKYVVIATLYDDVIYKLPCYQWLTNETNTVTLRDGKAVLPSEESSEYLTLQRELETQERQLMYPWSLQGNTEEYDGFPGYLSVKGQLPRDARFAAVDAIEEKWKIEFEKATKCSISIKRSLSEVFSVFFTDKPFEEKQELLADLEISETSRMQYILENWTKDEEFGRQILQGPNCHKIQPLRELPENFPVTEYMIADFLDAGASLQRDLSLGKFFLLSYPELQSAVTPRHGQRYYTCAPMCLMYAREHDGLIPVAIQLTQSPTQSSPIYTPADSKGLYNDWLIAKMWVKSAEVNHQIYSTHLLHTHLVMEPVALALLRNFPSVHPLYKFLHPHMENILAINSLYRQLLLPGGKLLSRLMAIGEDGASHIDFLREEFATFQFQSLNVKASLEEHELSYCPLLTQYSYPKHAIALWDMIEEFVNEMVGLFYVDDAAVQEDVELQNFLRELKTIGFPHGAGLPERFMSRESVVTFCTCVLNTSTVRHAQVSEGLLDYYGYAPIACPAFTAGPPAFKRERGLEPSEMKKLLPSTEDSLLFTTLMKLMTTSKCKTDLCAVKYPLFTSETPQKIISRFQEKVFSYIQANRKYQTEPMDLEYSDDGVAEIQSGISC